MDKSFKLLLETYAKPGRIAFEQDAQTNVNVKKILVI